MYSSNAVFLRYHRTSALFRNIESLLENGNETFFVLFNPPVRNMEHIFLRGLFLYFLLTLQLHRQRL